MEGQNISVSSISSSSHSSVTAMVSRLLRCVKSKKTVHPFIIFVMVMAVSFSYLCLFVNRGWIPPDEGVLGQQAVRWMAGELPHRDFHEVYSGGLTALNGLAFSFLGTDALSLRYLLLAIGLLCLCSAFYIFKDVFSPWKAAVMTLVTLVWSFPNYFSGLPSWYVITFWCLGFYSLAKHFEIISIQKDCSLTGARWLFLFGVFLGCSILIKINGIFFVAVGILYLCHLAVFRPRPLIQLAPTSRLGSVFVFLVVLGFLGCVFWISRLMPTLGVFYFLFLPNLFVSIYLFVRIIKVGGISVSELWNFLFRCGFIFGGVLVTLLPFVIYYIHQGAFGDLLSGLFVRPAQRLGGASYPFPGLRGVLCGLILPVVLVVGKIFKGEKYDRVFACGIGLALSVVLMAQENAFLRGALFFSIRSSAPPLAVTMCLFLMFKSKAWSALVVHRLFLATVSLSVASLIQFPDAYVIYFYYMSPFLWILLGYVGGLSIVWPRSFMVFCGFLILFPLVVLNDFGRVRHVPLALSRASLLVPEEDEKIYFPLVGRIQSLLKPGEPVFAGPDCPEISFLSERPNPTKILYELLEKQEGLEESLLSILQKGCCAVAVINLQPGYSRSYSERFIHELMSCYKRVEKYGHFVLFSDFVTKEK